MAAGRGLRAKPAVNYSQGALESKGAATPVWMKSRSRSEGSTEKENSSGQGAGASQPQRAPARDNGKQKGPAPAAQRGRNAGVTLVPISECRAGRGARCCA